MEAAFARLKQVKTVHTALLAFAAIGFGLFTGPVLQNLYLEERFDLDALERGLLGSFGGLFVARDPARSRRGLRRPLPARTPPRRCGSSGC